MIDIKLLPEFAKRKVLGDERPCFNALVEGVTVGVLYDTGADSTVWCRDLKRFLECFPNAKRLVGCHSTVNGFGLKDDTRFPVYSIPKFNMLGIKIENLPVIIKPSSLVPDLVLQANVFKNNIVGLDLKNRVMRVDYSKPIRMCKYLYKGYYVGSVVFTGENDALYTEFVDLDEVVIPDDFISYAKVNGLTVDELAEKVYACMPGVYRDDSKSVLENALKSWDTYKKFN